VPDRLLAIAAGLSPPFVLLEDGRGAGKSMLAWAPLHRVRIEWTDAAVGTLDALTLGDDYIGVIAYDLGIPPHAGRRAPMIAQPLADLFVPTQRITLRPGMQPEITGDDARARWGVAAGESWRGVDEGDEGARAATAGALRAVRPPERQAPPSRRSLDQAQFEAAVQRALEYIRAGDIYQVNLSVAERAPLGEPAFDVYRRLRAINPSPWMGYADFGDWQLVGGSPELLVEVRDGTARARPIAGTRKKTGKSVPDAAMRRELMTDAKEAAEHVMLVDLARNDLGRIAEFGSVRVAELGAVEEYSHVMHLVSDVVATVVPGTAPLDVFRAMFPGGTITGTPKIRAMEIIAELEPVARGFYTGALGWTGRDAAQWNIIIRSAVVRDGEVVIQAGAGIVADSDPAREWKESLRKAAALRLALGLEE
jgi:para-aminobenzoate synthetase component 1